MNADASVLEGALHLVSDARGEQLAPVLDVLQDVRSLCILLRKCQYVHVCCRFNGMFLALAAMSGLFNKETPYMVQGRALERWCS